ncbi:SRPBCC family protein [Agromyces sp. CCNWLW203]|uniref:SRPBCC family protein n=1 Tax=Agromyces sp. CCNWLW203 TaxID=3112842 RepID=UPI002F9634B5
MVEFECRTHLPMTVQQAFDLSRNIDVHVVSMADSQERAVAGVTAGVIGPHEEVTWRARHFGVPMRMTVRITEFHPPSSFVDEQSRGPFRSFRHEHEFTADAVGGTTMIDRVRFVAPLGLLGRAAEGVLGPYLRRLIEHRNAHLAASSGH